MSILNRSKSQSINIWLGLSSPLEPVYERIIALQQFLTAPNNAFLALDILQRFLECETLLLNSQVTASTELSQHFETAKHCLNELQNKYPINSDEYTYLKLEQFLEITRDPKYRKKRQKKNRNETDNASYFLMNDEEFIESSLWHDYMDDYPVYVSLFYPFIPILDNTSATFKLALETNNHLKAFWLNVIAEKKAYITDSRLRDSSRAMRKLISKTVYRHLNTPNYKRIKTLCELYQFIGNLNLSKDNLSETEQFLKDSSSFTTIKLNDDDIRWVKDSAKMLRNFFKPFCIDPNKKKNKPTKRGEDKSKRAKYNRQVGLTLTTDIKNAHKIEKLQSSNNSFKAKTIRINNNLISGNDHDIIEQENSDDLEEESVTDDIIWPSNPPCELQNPITSLINGQQLLPHIAINNQLLRPRAIKSDIEEIQKLILWTSNDFKVLSTKHMKATLKFFLLLLTGRIIKKIETEEFVLKEDSAYLNIDKSILKLRIPQYGHIDLLTHRDVYVESDTDILTLRLPPEIKEILAPIVSHTIKKNSDETSVIKFEVTKKQDNKYAGHKLDDFSKFVQRSYSKISNDIWLLSIFTWQVGGIQNTQKHYASYRQRDAQKIFEKHCKSFLNLKITQHTPSYQKNERVGSPYYLNRKTYSKIIRWLWDHAENLNRPLNYKSVNWDTLMFQFNCLAFWIDSATSFATASRNIIDPSITLGLISKDGLYRINDKDKYDGFNTRLTYIPPKLKNKLKLYKSIREKILIFITKKGIGLSKKEKTIINSQQLFFFQTNIKRNTKIVSYTRSRCRDEIYEQARAKLNLEPLGEHTLEYEYLRALKTNVNRHYLRGRLLELNVPGVYIDALLGHWHSGTQPWGKMSIFNQATYLDTLRTHIPKILRELGFDFEANTL